ncbi:T-cell surface glycoprotein CD1c-like [Mobula hypostoma]|uniref:T-cell surface glycoprotein CD1c-like n=1 Tax=Mobula hypostoma TaxID=723540 RepID=UPI002FC2BF9E
MFSHSLTYFYLHSINIPELLYISMVGMLDDLQICYYDSTIQRVEAKQEWIMDGFSANNWKNQKEIPDIIKNLLLHNLTPFVSMPGIRYIQGLLGCAQSANTFKTFLKIGCQVAPEVQVLKKRPTATEGESLPYIITPFYPRAINATWLKNGQVVSKGYEVTVLPNYNDTYWMELVIELQDNDTNIYICHVKHSSLLGY